jgi:hypothetical protein
MNLFRKSFVGVAIALLLVGCAFYEAPELEPEPTPITDENYQIKPTASVSGTESGTRAAGIINKKLIYNIKRVKGYYWTATPNPDNPNKAECMVISSSGTRNNSYSRAQGSTVRCKKIIRPTGLKKNKYIAIHVSMGS